MKKTNSRLIAVLLVAAMALSVLVACGQPADSGDENTPGDGETTPAAAVDTTPAETTENPYDENGYLKDEIPEDIIFSIRSSTFCIGTMPRTLSTPPRFCIC